MSRICRICLESTRNEQDYHARCLKRLFGIPTPPTLNVETGKLHTLALAMVGHTSLSGIQKKISIGLSADRTTLQVAALGGLYILKPPAGTYPALPENEHVTTRLASLTGIGTTPNGLIRLQSGELSFIARRFDRLPDGHKLRQEDFCQLAEFSPKQKYEGTAELCVRLTRQYSSEPLVEILKLFRLMVFTWWTGNGDMHLKNFSLLTGTDGITRLTPAYDLLCTRLVIPDDPLALPVGGKKDKLRRADWLKFAAYCNLPERAAVRVLKRQAEISKEAVHIIERSFLPQDQKDMYIGLILKNSQILTS